MTGARRAAPTGSSSTPPGACSSPPGPNRQNPPYETQEKPTAGIYVFSPAGKLLEMIPIPRDECTNCAFGGGDFKTLFVTAGGTLWSVRLNEPGLTVWNGAK